MFNVKKVQILKKFKLKNVQTQKKINLIIRLKKFKKPDRKAGENKQNPKNKKIY
jgi:hypothetical protein